MVFDNFLKKESELNYESLYIPYESPNMWVLDFVEKEGIAAPKKEPRP